MNRKQKYYAVANGRNPGVYRNYQACLEQIDRYPDAFFKSFESENEAVDWLALIIPMSRALILPCYVVGSQSDRIQSVSRCQVVQLPDGIIYQESYVHSLSALHLFEYLVITDLLEAQHAAGEAIPIYTANKAVLHWIANTGQNSSLLNDPNCPSGLRNAAKDADTWLGQHPRCRGVGLWMRAQWGAPPVFTDDTDLAA